MSSWAVGDDTVVARLRSATVPRTESRDPVPARFALELRPHQDPAAVSDHRRTSSRGLASTCHAIVGPGPADTDPRPPGPSAGTRAPRCLFRRGLCPGRAVRPGRRRTGPTHCLLPRARRGPKPACLWVVAFAGFPPGCFVDPQPALEPTPAWALDRMQRPRRLGLLRAERPTEPGKDVIVAQPDTGITPHVELVGVAFVPGFDVIDDDNDPTDPLTETRQPRARHGNRKCPGVAGQLRRHGLGPSGVGSCRSAPSRAWCGSGRSRSPARSTGRSKKEPTSSP